VSGSAKRVGAQKARGAFFTPPAIADYLAAWAVGDNAESRVLDPSCGEAVFLLAAARRLRELGRDTDQIASQVYGVDIEEPSLAEASRLLSAEGLDARLIERDVFEVPTPLQLGSFMPELDAVIGNPPFIRYHEHRGEARKKAAAAALAQGVQISGLASSWAPLLVHACGFLRPEGRVAMVVPAELLTVHYAEPVRRWLRQRFAAVHLVMFDRLQFHDALERVLLLVAQGSGGCDAFSLYQVEDASDLPKLRPFDHLNVTPAEEGKWTDVLLTQQQRRAFRSITAEAFAPLDAYGAPELGTVTGANDYFVISEPKRVAAGLTEDQLVRVSPPGTRHLKGLSLTQRDWKELLTVGEPVWLLRPDADDTSPALAAYLREGAAHGVNDAYKCRIRDPWWRPPLVPRPDLFFTYMSHRYPRLIENRARVAYLNSMHGIRLRKDAPSVARQALPLLALNSVSMLGAELYGRAYGGGILKMEPREARTLPVPNSGLLEVAWRVLADDAPALDERLRAGQWEPVVERVNQVLLGQCAGISAPTIAFVAQAVDRLRSRRLAS
jgi:adenine-specific DNA-methyltransferase